MGAPKGNMYWEYSDLKTLKGFIKKGNFINESHFCDLIENNIRLICNIVLGESFVSMVREYELPSPHNKKPKVDFAILTDKGFHFIECKDPKSRAQYSVYQLLKYKTIAENYSIKVDRLISLSTEFDKYDKEIVDRFNLPVELFYISKEKVFSYGSSQINK